MESIGTRKHQVTPEPYYQDEAVTIYLGDSMSILPTLSNIDGIVTDPPYSSGGAMRSDRTTATITKYVQTGTQRESHDFHGDNRDQRSFLVWCTMWLAACYNVSNPNAVLASFIDWRQLPTLSDAIQAGGWVWRGIAVWDKGFGRPMPGRFSGSSEYLLSGSKGAMTQTDEYPPGIFHSPTPKDRQHITQKPEAVMQWAMRIVKPGGMVLDPFMGSGTTIKMAKETGRKAIGIELDERFAEIAANRCAETFYIPPSETPEVEDQPSLFGLG